MMKTNTIMIIIAVMVMLTAGWLLFRTLNSPVTPSPEDEGFRAWFWEMRGLDLVVQVLLVFAGALGIAAILPVEDEDD
jgi:multisubunit Na+/H+ antiporter MnhB subunit